tara:strand:+ start:28919 stop:29830 length:912 start_codon:yes stop_codon:yes gene_type:complete
MQKNSSKTILGLHFLVFIWGFTSILGALITLDSISLVWYRLIIASFLIFFLFKKKVKLKELLFCSLGGILITTHWILFFHSIKISSVSIAVIMLSTGALLTSLLEPIFFNRKIYSYEFSIGLVAVAGIYFIFKSESSSIEGILIALVATFFSALFAILNSYLVKVRKYNFVSISFLELLTGLIFLTIYMIFFNKFQSDFFKLKLMDFIFLFLLGSIGTAFAFIYTVKLMKEISPYTLMLTMNLEPVYAIILSIVVFGEKEILGFNFYLGSLIILLSIFLNSLIKFNYFKKLKILKYFKKLWNI